ncbi:hypothetical protein ABPG77_003142 [Micractinium sp. CCAP 211/92]
MAAPAPAPAAAMPEAEDWVWDAAGSSAVPAAEPSDFGAPAVESGSHIELPMAAGAPAAAVPFEAGWDDGFADFSAAPPLQSHAAPAVNIAGQPHAAADPFAASALAPAILSSAREPPAVAYGSDSAEEAAGLDGMLTAVQQPMAAGEATALVEDPAWAWWSGAAGTAALAHSRRAGSSASAHTEEEEDEFADLAEAEARASSPPSASATEAGAASAQEVVTALSPAQALQEQLSDLSFMLSPNIC